MKRIIIYMLISISFFASSCKKYLDVNSPNPNNPISVTPALLLPGALNATVTIMTASAVPNDTDAPSLTFDFLGWWMGYWVVSGTFVPPTVDVQYAEPNTYKQELWASLYHNINDYKNIGNAGVATGQSFYTGVAKIMEAYDFQTLVDLWGNVPYKQALNGTSLLLPKYDDAQAIYASLLLKVDSGIALIKSDAVTNPGANDIMFAGDHGKWVRFANTVKLRMLIRQSQVTGIQAAVTTELGKAGADGYLKAGEGAYVNPGYQNSQYKQNPFWAEYGYTVSLSPSGNNQYYRAALFGLNFYQTRNDPRLGYFYSPNNTPSATVAPTYLGGTFGAQGVPSESGIGGNGADGNGTIQDATKPVPSGVLQGSGFSAVLISSFENQFLLAEAAYRGWITGDPQAYYNEAITESFQFLNVANATTAAATYYSQPIKDVSYAASPNKLEAIITQKWASLNAISMLEAYNDYRRLGYPLNLPQSPQATHAIPRRLLYPQTEQSTNAANVASQPTKIFWDPLSH